MAEGRVGVDGVDRRRKTVPHVGTADRLRKPVFRTGSEFSVSRLLWSYWSGVADESRLSWTRRGQPSTLDSDDEELDASELRLWRWCGAWAAASVGLSELLWCWIGGQDNIQRAKLKRIRHVCPKLVSLLYLTLPK